ncbi:MAG: hypothetical protein HZA60_08655 [Deltaproteobacteria bacterium]|nr:hypothetical protein [Deltaproteobacteria bacterium]
MDARRSAPFYFRPGKGILCVLFLAAFVLGVAMPGNSGDLKVLGGLVESVSGDYVTLKDGRSHDIKGVTVADPSGRRLSIADIVRGKKVDLFFRSGKLTSVLVYDPMVE